MRSLMLLALISSTALAQTPNRSFTSKFFLFAGLAGTGLSGKDVVDETEFGGGVHIGAGYGFTRAFSLFANSTSAAMGSKNGDYRFGHFDFGVRYSFANAQSSWIPFLEGARSGRATSQGDVALCTTSCTTSDRMRSGNAFTFGGGIHYFASPKLAITTSLHWSIGTFTHLRFAGVTFNDVDAKGTSARIHLGLTWFPAATRRVAR